MTTLTATTADSPPLEVEDLRELMRAVSHTTDRLQQTHDDLQGQVARLQSELAAANAQLRRSRSLAALGEMAAGIAHEVRNPLGSIQLYAQLLADDVADRPESVAVCEKIGRAVEGLDAIVKDVLTFARDTIVRPAPIDAATLFDRAGCGSAVEAQRGRVAIDDSGVGACRFVADAGLLVQALGNIVRNAIEAACVREDVPRRIELGAERRRVRCPDGRRRIRVVLSVSDSGPGVSPETIDRMFNPFFTTRASGTGLGLAIVHRIVDAHGGHINVNNGPLGGARVELCLPPEPTPTDTPLPSAMDTEGISLTRTVRRRTRQEGDA
jgi:signal transduction histidine kinase